MKVALLVSGQTRFPYHGHAYISDLCKNSKHHIDVYVTHWSGEIVPNDIISSQIYKGCKSVDNSVVVNFYHSAHVENLTNAEFSEQTTKDRLPGLISHMFACELFANELKEYDCVVKWRWDVVTRDYLNFDDAVSKCVEIKGFVCDTIWIEEGRICANDIVFFAHTQGMLETFQPAKEKFLFAAAEWLKDAAWLKRKMMISPLSWYPKLVQIHCKSLSSMTMSIVLLRENILEKDPNNLLSYTALHTLQNTWERERDIRVGRIQ